ncbi:hypothetical protein, partial [Actinoplanes teichomyceticus]
MNMRLFRPVLGMLLLTIGLPALLTGGCLWAVLRHRDAGGAFSAELQRLSVPGYAIVVPDVDRLLRDDASFARIGDTELRVTAFTAAGPAFVGLAPADAVAGYLRGVPHTEIRGVQVGTGELPLTTAAVSGVQVLPSAPGRQDFWTRTGGGALRWSTTELTGAHSLVIMNATGAADLRLNGTVEARPGWLDPAAWGLLSLGALLLMAGVVVLATPSRRREVVYVVEPSQVPDLMRAIGAPIPLRALAPMSTAHLDRGAPPVPASSGVNDGTPRGLDGAAPLVPASNAAGDGFGGDVPLLAASSATGDGVARDVPLPAASSAAGDGVARGAGHGTARRPRTLADSRPVRPPALPQFAWPPKNPGLTGGGSVPLSPTPAGTLSGTPISTPGHQDAPDGIRPGGITPVVPGALPIPAVPGRSDLHAPDAAPPGVPEPALGAVVGLESASGAVVGLEPAPSAVAGLDTASGAVVGLPSASGAVVAPEAAAGTVMASGAAAAAAVDAAATAGTAGADLTGSTGSAATVAATPNPAPGKPLGLLGDTGPRTAPPGSRPDRPGRRRGPAPADLAEFHATAVGAWVAETAPERARQTEARAAAALAEAARTRAAKSSPAAGGTARTGPTSPPGETPEA